MVKLRWGKKYVWKEHKSVPFFEGVLLGFQKPCRPHRAWPPPMRPKITISSLLQKPIGKHERYWGSAAGSSPFLPIQGPPNTKYTSRLRRSLLRPLLPEERIARIVQEITRTLVRGSSYNGPFGIWNRYHQRQFFNNFWW